MSPQNFHVEALVPKATVWLYIQMEDEASLGHNNVAEHRKSGDLVLPLNASRSKGEIRQPLQGPFSSKVVVLGKRPMEGF